MMDATQLQTNQKANADKLMSDRVVLITGASRGIGAATAKLLGCQGAAVGVNYYTNEAAAQAIVDEITSIGGKALPDFFKQSGEILQCSEVYKVLIYCTDVANAASLGTFGDSHKWCRHGLSESMIL